MSTWPREMVAFIPARAGSQRVPGKNMRLLGGKPLLQYSIDAALESGIFSQVIVSTEDWDTGECAEQAGARWIWRPPTFSTDHSPDIDWLRFTLVQMGKHKRPDTFAILRPTSPFRTAETIQRAYREFTIPDGTHDSLRAVERVKQHPGKMWEWLGPGYKMTPLLSGTRSDGVPWHSAPTQTLPVFYVQNSSLEMAWTANVEVHGNLHGRKVIPFLTTEREGMTIDYPEDWERAERLLLDGEHGPALLARNTGHVSR